jgi:hypothetical protein
MVCIVLTPFAFRVSIAFVGWEKATTESRKKYVKRWVFIGFYIELFLQIYELFFFKDV